MIDICFCSDIHLVKFIPVVINSIQDKNKNNQINVHYIHNIIEKEPVENLKKYVEQFNNLKFYSYYKTWDFNYKGLKHITNATMLRIYIPEIINVSKIIYFDIDIIVNADLKPMFNLDCGPTGIILKTSIVKNDNNTVLLFDGTRKSGNCGVIVMNLDTLRKNKFTEKCITIHQSNPNRHDQFLINTYCNGYHNKLNPKLNVFIGQDDHIINNEKGDYILHYVGSIKPYNSTTKVKFQEMWDKYANNLNIKY